MKPSRQTLERIYDRLLKAYGPQGWWPAETRFEVMVGAMLTQNTSWTNVEKALANIKAADALTAGALREVPQDDLATLVYPSGYYNGKARKLKALAEYLGRRFDDDIDAMKDVETAELRAELLDVYGIGEETADDIMLYAVGKPVVVVDAYTRRVFARLGLANEDAKYGDLQSLFQGYLAPDPHVYREYHALIVRHANETCRKSPECESCCLLDLCPTGAEKTRGR